VCKKNSRTRPARSYRLCCNQQQQGAQEVLRTITVVIQLIRSNRYFLKTHKANMYGNTASTSMLGLQRRPALHHTEAILQSVPHLALYRLRQLLVDHSFAGNFFQLDIETIEHGIKPYKNNCIPTCHPLTSSSSSSVLMDFYPFWSSSLS